MVDVSFKYPRSGALIYRTYPDLKSTPKEIKYNGKMYLLYGVHREYDNPQKIQNSKFKPPGLTS